MFYLYRSFILKSKPSPHISLTLTIPPRQVEVADEPLVTDGEEPEALNSEGACYRATSSECSSARMSDGARNRRKF